MKLKPLFDKIVLEHATGETKKTSTLFVPEEDSDVCKMGKVVAVGHGGVVDGHKVEIAVKVGDYVLFNTYSANDFEWEGNKYIILKQTDILAVVQKEAE